MAPSAYQPRARTSPPGSWTDERILVALRDWAQAFGRAPRSYEWTAAPHGGRLSPGSVVWSRLHPRWPAKATVCRHFQRWSQALEAAGLPARTIAPGHGRTDRVLAARVLARDGATIRQIAQALEISPRTARDYLRAGVCADCGGPVITAADLCPSCAVHAWQGPTWAAGEVLGAMAEWTAQVGRTPRAEEWQGRSGADTKWTLEYPAWPSYATVRTLFGSWTAALRAAGFAPPIRKWDRPSIVAALQAHARQRGRPPKQSELGAGPPGPTPGTIRHHFGSWQAALRAAGLQATRKRWSRERVLLAFWSFRDTHGRWPKARGWTASTAEHPHATTVRRLFGSWAAALEEASGLATRPHHDPRQAPCPSRSCLS